MARTRGRIFASTAVAITRMAITLAAADSSGSVVFAPVSHGAMIVLPALLDSQPMVLTFDTTNNIDRQLQLFCSSHLIPSARCRVLHEAVDDLLVLETPDQRPCKHAAAEQRLGDGAFLHARQLLVPGDSLVGEATATWVHDDPRSMAVDICRFLSDSRMADTFVDTNGNADRLCADALLAAFTSSFGWINALPVCRDTQAATSIPDMVHAHLHLAVDDTDADEWLQLQATTIDDAPETKDQDQAVWTSSAVVVAMTVVLVALAHRSLLYDSQSLLGLRSCLSNVAKARHEDTVVVTGEQEKSRELLALAPPARVLQRGHHGAALMKTPSHVDHARLPSIGALAHRSIVAAETTDEQPDAAPTTDLTTSHPPSFSIAALSLLLTHNILDVESLPIGLRPHRTNLIRLDRMLKAPSATDAMLQHLGAGQECSENDLVVLRQLPRARYG